MKVVASTNNFDSDFFISQAFYPRTTTTTYTTSSGTRLQRSGSLAFIFDPNNQSKISSMATTVVLGVAIATSPYIVRTAISYAAEFGVRMTGRLVMYGWEKYWERKRLEDEARDAEKEENVVITITEAPTTQIMISPIPEEDEEDLKEEEEGEEEEEQNNYRYKPFLSVNDILCSSDPVLNGLLRECNRMSTSASPTFPNYSDHESIYSGWEEARTVCSRDIDNCEIHDDFSIFSFESISRRSTPSIAEVEVEIEPKLKNRDKLSDGKNDDEAKRSPEKGVSSL